MFVGGVTYDPTQYINGMKTSQSKLLCRKKLYNSCNGGKGRQIINTINLSQS
jgi:hypothetical protein